MNFEPIQFSDLPVVTSLSPEGWGNVPIKIQHYIESPFCFPIKLLVDQKIVAIGATIVHNDVAWLGHIIVAPDERGKGYGKQTTQELIRIANRKKCNSIQLIATDMGAPVYTKLGFKESSSYLFFDDIQAPCLEEVDNNIQHYQSRYMRLAWRFIGYPWFNRKETAAVFSFGSTTLEFCFKYIFNNAIPAACSLATIRPSPKVGR